MDNPLLWGVVVIGVINIVLLLVILTRSSKSGGGEVREELRLSRTEAAQAARDAREEISKSLSSLSELQRNQLDVMSKQIQASGKSNSDSLERIRETFDIRVKEMQTSNEQKLDQMRQTVDEKLQTTLEKRLGESFKLVSERLEAVQRGLGEMQTLANGVGDLSRILTNVKARGTWSEVQLGVLLEQYLAPNQFERNIKTIEGSDKIIEFVVKIPGAGDHQDSQMWLPIDSKFPTEDYGRLQEAAEANDPQAVKKATADLAATFLKEGERIAQYLNPPTTTDYAIMFLPTEGLYAEAVRHPSVSNDLQRKYRVIIAGPTTLAAILSSLAMGFRTMAIGQQSAEVWRVLGAVKTEFSKFAGVLDSVKKKLDQASKTIDETGVRTRAMNRALRDVESLPENEATTFFGDPSTQAIDAAGGSETLTDED